MNALDLTGWFMVAMRWLHILAAAAWVGGSIFFFAVLRPALRGSSGGPLLARLAGQEFRQMVDVAIWVLLVSGVIISVDRLTSGHSTPTYGVVLALKIAFSLWMFGLVWFRRRSSSTMPPEEAARNPTLLSRVASVLTPTNLILALGILVLLLAEVLGYLFEQSMAG